MANHVRKQSRDQAVSLLLGLSLTGSRVYASRLQPLDNSELPCLLVNTDSENIAPQEVGNNPLLERQLDLKIKVLVQAASGFDATADSIMRDIEIKLNTAPASATLNGLVHGIELTGIEVNYDAEGAQPVAEAVMTFSVIYYTLAAAPDVSI